MSEFQGGGYPDPHYTTEDTSVFTFKQWVITLIVMMIPCVNIIMCFVWGFSSGGNLNRKNFCKAQLVVIAISILLIFVFYAILGAAFFSVFNDIYNY
jgi:hypothetical protein